MSTRSHIAIKEIDSDKIKSIYCHFDGYYTNGVGEMLAHYYSDPEKVKELISLGDISCLAPEIKDVKAYHRDMGEEYKEPREYCSSYHYFKKDSSVDYKYLYLEDQNEWIFTKYIYKR